MNGIDLEQRRSEEHAKRERVRIFNGGPEQFVTAAVLAEVLGFSRDWVYQHKRELSGIPSGVSEPRARRNVGSLGGVEGVGGPTSRRR